MLRTDGYDAGGDADPPGSMVHPWKRISRELLAALACGLAGPAAVWVVLAALGPDILAASVPQPSAAGVLVGVLRAGIVLVLLAIPVFALATAAALVLTRTPYAGLAVVAVFVVTPPWLSLLSAAADQELVLAGVAPAAVRLVFGLLGSGDLHRVAA